MPNIPKKYENTWKKAVNAFKKQYKHEPKSDKEFAIVSSIFDKMGGKFNENIYGFVDKFMENKNMSWKEKSELLIESNNVDKVKKLLLKITGKNSKIVDKMIKDFYDLAIRRGSATPKEIANDIFSFAVADASHKYESWKEKLKNFKESLTQTIDVNGEKINVELSNSHQQALDLHTGKGYIRTTPNVWKEVSAYDALKADNAHLAISLAEDSTNFAKSKFAQDINILKLNDGEVAHVLANQSSFWSKTPAAQKLEILKLNDGSVAYALAYFSPYWRNTRITQNLDVLKLVDGRVALELARKSKVWRKSPAAADVNVQKLSNGNVVKELKRHPEFKDKLEKESLNWEEKINSVKESFKERVSWKVVQDGKVVQRFDDIRKFTYDMGFDKKQKDEIMRLKPGEKFYTSGQKDDYVQKEFLKSSNMIIQKKRNTDGQSFSNTTSIGIVTKKKKESLNWEEKIALLKEAKSVKKGTYKGINYEIKELDDNEKPTAKDTGFQFFIKGRWTGTNSTLKAAIATAKDFIDKHYNKLKESFSEVMRLDNEQNDVLEGIVSNNRKKSNEEILKIVIKDPLYKGINKKVLLDAIEDTKYTYHWESWEEKINRVQESFKDSVHFIR